MNARLEDPSWNLQSIVDRARIRDCIERLSRGEDRRDADLIGGAYWPDATDDHGIFSGKLKEYLAWVVPGSSAIPVTLHTLGQSLIDLRGNIALVETHVTSYHRINMGEQERDIVIGGRYLDRMEARKGEWRIAHRTMIYDWLKDFGQSVDWSQGVLGMPFQAGHYTGKSNGDYSEAFFKQK